MAKVIITSQIEQLCSAEANAYVDMIQLRKDTGTPDEIFTNFFIVKEHLKHLPDELWEEGKTFVDPECGIGQQIVPAAIIKRELGHTEILSCIFGTDIKEDLVAICRTRLLDVCGHTKENIKLVKKNIVCCDSFTYGFDFE